MRFLLTAVMIALVAAGCASENKREKQDPLAVSTPLPLDPTDSYEIAVWWTNGKQLLQLTETGVYRLYQGINRYHMPAERSCR